MKVSNWSGAEDVFQSYTRKCFICEIKVRYNFHLALGTNCESKHFNNSNCHHTFRRHNRTTITPPLLPPTVEPKL